MARLDKAIAYLYAQSDLGSDFKVKACKVKACKLMLAEM